MTKENFTAIGIVIDESGSMSSLQKDTIGGFNTFLRDQKAVPGDAILTLATFSDQYHLIHNAIPLHSVPELTEKTYRPAGSTALLDAIGRTVNTMGNHFSAMKEEDRPSKVVLLIMTDGEENASKEFKHERIREMVKHQQEKYSWSVVYIGANVDAWSVGGGMGIAKGSSYNFASTSIGTSRLYGSMSAGMSKFRSSAPSASFIMEDPMQDPMEDPMQDPATTPADPTDKTK